MNFEISLQELCRIVTLYQDKAEDSRGAELKLVEKHGGNKYLLHGLFSSAGKGIRRNSIEERVNYYGSNAQKLKEVKSFCRLIWEALSDFTLRILIVAAVLSVVLEMSLADEQRRKTNWIEGVSILLAVAICALVTAVNNRQKEKQFLKLNEISEDRKVYTVVRESETLVVSQNDLVTGDIVIVREGSEVPVDGWLLEAAEIHVDESSMTGESEPVAKAALEDCLAAMKKSTKHDLPSPLLMSGTRVVSGQGKMICLVVGANSCIGRIRSLVEERKQTQTPLQVKLEKLATDIGKFGLYASIVIVVVLLIRFAIERGTQRSWDSSKHIPELVDFFLIGITVVVVAIPEGLPLAVTLTLAYSVRKMLMDNNLVRRMEACQTMGGASVICSDKTGTLTLNKMSVTVWWNDDLHVVQPYSQSRLDYYKFMHEEFQELMQVNLFVNSSAELRPEPLGSCTEIALMTFGERIGGRYGKFRQEFPVLKRYPFNSTRKRMSVLVELKEHKYLLTKGASEIILGRCSTWLNCKTMLVHDIDAKTRSSLEETITKMAEKGLRTIVLAHRRITADDDINLKGDGGIFKIENENLVLMAVFGVKDLPREQVPEAIVQCRRAGIKVKMVTGDNLVTATAIAKEIGIIQPHKPSLCLEGHEFNRIVGGVVCALCRTEKCDCSFDGSDKTRPLRKDVIKNEQDFDRLIKNLDVLARSRPEDKYALVTGLINKGIVVAVTGDGTNDAPALKKADVGFAMGRSGTEIAREASSIVLLDDNFNSIVKAVLWGRNIYDSIKKFIQFQLTVNVVAVLTTLIGALVLRQNILTPIQMLWLNMIMDTLASLALATETPTEGLLDRKPHNRDEYIITKRMLKHIVMQSLYQLLIVMLLVFLGEWFIPEVPDDFDRVLGAANLAVKYNKGIVEGGYVSSGRLYHTFSSVGDYKPARDLYQVPSRHFTVVFNSFVMMQIFNFFNCRKLYDELNVLEGITRNWLFLVIVLLIVCLQVVIVTFGSVAFELYSYYGLTLMQWLICVTFVVIQVGLGMGSLVVSLLTKLVPETEMCMDRVDVDIGSARVNRSYMLALRPREKPEEKTSSSSEEDEQRPKK